MGASSLVVLLAAGMACSDETAPRQNGFGGFGMASADGGGQPPMPPGPGCTATPDCGGCTTCPERCFCLGNNGPVCQAICVDGVTSSGTGGDPGAGGAPPMGCASASIESELLPSNILFLLDRSGSMNCNLPPLQTSADCEADPVPVDPTQPTKWDVVTAGLLDAISQLPPGSSAGLTYFSNNNVCGAQSSPNVPVLPVDQPQFDTFTASIASTTPRGPTPIIGATILGYKHLHEQARLPGNNFVVLITDGADTCDPEQATTLIQAEIPKARSVNIRTFAIGAPGSENGRALLSSIAWEGGTANDPGCDHSITASDVGDCHFDMTTSVDFAADLSAALAAISGNTITCEFDIPPSPDGVMVDLGKVNVDYFPGGTPDPMPILQDTTQDCAAGAEGWQYSPDNTKIVLCGSICDTVKSDVDARVEIVLGCETVVVR